MFLDLEQTPDIANVLKSLKNRFQHAMQWLVLRVCLQISLHGVRRHRGISSYQIDSTGRKVWRSLLGLQVERDGCDLDGTFVNIDAVEIALQDVTADLGRVCDVPFFLIELPQKVESVDE